MSYDIKQVIVMRTDLNMRKGKMVAQGSHASMKVFFDLMRPVIYHKSDGKVETMEYILDIYQEPNRKGAKPFLDRREMAEWKEGKFAKIVVAATSEDQLLDLYQQAQDAGLPVALITDEGYTEFNGVATNTCIAIGPANKTEIDKITGDLKLL